MNNLKEPLKVQTSLKSQRPSWQEALLITTTLYLFGFNKSQGDAQSIGGSYTGRFDGISFNGSNPSSSGYLSSGTVVEYFAQPHVLTYVTTLNQIEETAENFDFAIKPKYRQEFVLKYTSIKVEKFIPRIFAD